MHCVEEFRGPRKARALLAEIVDVVEALGATRDRPVHNMKICGEHTHTIFR